MALAQDASAGSPRFLCLLYALLCMRAYSGPLTCVFIKFKDAFCAIGHPDLVLVPNVPTQVH